mgnify:CR=1 FL=1
MLKLVRKLIEPVVFIVFFCIFILQQFMRIFSDSDATEEIEER